MFGCWEIASLGDKEACLAVGIRSATDKSMAIGLCAGERVFVCDNLVFSSSFVLFRKHTGRLIEEEIRLIAREALNVVVNRFPALQEWHRQLQKVQLTMQQAAILTMAAMHERLVPPSQYPEFYDLFLSPKADHYDLTLHGFHGAVTELLRERNLMTVHLKNDRLNRFLDHETKLLLDPNAKGDVRFDLDALHRQAGEQAWADESGQVKAGRAEVQEVKRKVRMELRGQAKAAKAKAEKKPKAEEPKVEKPKAEKKPKTEKTKTAKVAKVEKVK